MRKLILLSIAALLCTIFQSNAQSGVSCTLEDINGEVVRTDLVIGNEVQLPILPTVCFYPVQLSITAIDGMADQNVLIRVQAGGAYNVIHILPAGQQSVSVFPNNAFLLLPCGTSTNVQFSVIGNPSSSCIDQAFFPVEFTRFEANNTDDDKIQLIWETASEIDNEGFDIERSQDGYKWEILDSMKGAGTTLEKQYYEWTDDKPYSQQVNYYRLKQIDFDGDVEYSEIVTAKVLGNDEITLFPNPASDFVTLDLGENLKIEQLELYDMQGRLLRTLPIQYGISRQNMLLDDLMAGVYWVVISSKYTREQIKLIKQ